MPKHRLTPQAKADVRSIRAWTLRTWGSEQWERYLGELQAGFRRLAEVPGMGTVCDQVRPGYRRFAIREHYVYYRIEDDGIVVIRVYPHRMLPRKEMLDEGRA